MKNLIKSTIPTALFHQIRYFLLHRSFGNFTSPKKFSEKIFFRMIHPHINFSILADKVLAREYIAKKVGHQYLVPIIGSVESLTIPFYQSLPSKFVMKANHSAGDVLVVTDKRNFPFEILKKISDDWLKKDFYLKIREKHYSEIQRKILFEHLIGDGSVPPDDYKVHIFNSPEGNIEYVFIQHMWGRSDNLSQKLYDREWVPLPFQRKGFETKTLSDAPKQVDELIDISHKLCQPFSYMRVDFYIHLDKVMIGEITVTPGGGSYVFNDKKADDFLGSFYHWPEY